MVHEVDLGVELVKVSEIRFRYLADGGDFFDDSDADWFEANGYGSTHDFVVARRATS